MSIRKPVAALFLSLFLATLPARAQEAHPHWSYEGPEGPEHWGELSKDFATCAEGRHQSPIDLNTTAPLPGTLPPITVHYQPIPLDVVNNGHTLQVNVPPGSTITVGDKSYELVQFHFHAPSEHTLDGRHADMVVHLVHKSPEGQFGVIGVMMNKGAVNGALKPLWAHLPAKAGEEIRLPSVTLDPARLLPADLSYIGYTGSLTTPPCTEGVAWMIMTHVTSVSGKQLGKFTALFPHNARPLQPLNDRSLELSR